jgi:hypothetical protein
MPEMLQCANPECQYAVSAEMPICTKCGTLNPYYIAPLERRLARVKMELLQGDIEAALWELRDVDASWTVAPYKDVEVAPFILSRRQGE